MPQTNKEATWFREMRALQMRLTKLEHSQQMTISNSKAQPVLNLGLIPSIWAPDGSPSTYGLQIMDPGSGSVGTPLAQFGEVVNTSTGALEAGLWFYASDGKTPLIKVNETGMSVFDGSGNERTAFGLIGSEYGLATYMNGTAYMVNAPTYVESTSNTSLTTTTLTQLTGTTSETFTVGPSGYFGVQLSAQIALPGDASANVGAYVVVGYTINGGSTIYQSRAAYLQYSSGTSPEGPLATVATSDLINAGANASVTASLWGACSYAPSSGTCTVEGSFAQIVAY